MRNAGMIEIALLAFFAGEANEEFEALEKEKSLPIGDKPIITFKAYGGAFEKDSNGILTEKISIESLIYAKNVASERERRYKAHELAQKAISKLSRKTLSLKDDKDNFAGDTGVFEPVSWLDATDLMELDKKLMAVRVEFSVSMPSQSETEHTETGNKSLKECIRLAVKKQLELPEFGYRVIPTLGNWKFENKNETLAKVVWSGESEPANKSMSSFTRRQDTLFITIAVPNTPENWQDETSLIEENFNYSKISQPALIPLLPEDKKGSIGIVDILNMSVEHPALPEAYAVSKIAVNIQYAIKG